MYYRTYLIALIKILALLSLLPFFVGFFISLFRPKWPQTRIKIAGVIAYLIIEIAVIIDKGRPFFFANLIRIIGGTQLDIIAISAGIVGAILWCLVSIYLAVQGFALGMKLKSFKVQN